jgi:short-subunit dehydrogenase
VMISSVAGFSGAPEYAGYSASKAGMLAFAQALRVETARAGVHIGLVSPLFVQTPMLTGYNGATHLIRSGSLFFETRRPEDIAPYIVRGIERRQFMIFPGWRPHLLYLLSRYLDVLLDPITRLTYRQGGGQ